MLTNKFPCISGEQFIIPELYCAAGLCELTICPCVASISLDAPRVCEVPNAVAVEPLFSHGFSFPKKILRCFEAILRPAFRAELRSLAAGGELTYARLRSLAGFAARGERIFRALESRFFSVKADARETVIYSYWMNETAYAAALMKEKYGCACICRAHGGDLYAERRSTSYLPMRRYILSRLDLCCPVSAHGARYLTERYGFEDKISCFHLGSVDCGARATAPPGESFVIASCSSLIPVKRVHLIAEALCHITDRQVRWLHFGDGPELKAVEKAAAGLPPNIRFRLVGGLPHDRLMEYYRENDIHLFLNVSRYEGLPVSVMEAMSFGIPVIATDVGGTAELVQEVSGGQLIGPDFAPQELASAIRGVLEMDGGSYLRLRARARAYWQANFVAEANFARFYRRIAALPGRVEGM